MKMEGVDVTQERTTEFVPSAPQATAAPESLDLAEFTSPAADIDEVLPEAPADGLPPIPHFLRHPLRAAAWVLRAAFGIVSVILLLAVTAAIPIVNFAALGYLLDVEGRVARTGKLRHAFPLLDVAPRIGSIVLGVWVWVFPLRLLAGAAADAQLIAPGSATAANWETGLRIASILVAIHLCAALARGGSLSCFFRPIKNLRWLWPRLVTGQYWQSADRSVRAFVGKFHFRHYFWLGVRGFLGALAWLFIPTLLFAAAERQDGGPVLVTIFGGLCLMLVFSWMPFLQARFAAENRLRSMLEVRAIRGLFANAPLAWFVAAVVVYVLALPLYLLKVRLPPDDAMWLVTTVFIVSIYPARVVTGWAYHRAVRRGRPAGVVWRWGSRVAMIPLLGAYVFLLFFTQFISQYGKAALFEHHAFMLPVPF